MRLHCYYFNMLCLFFKDSTSEFEILTRLLRENVCDIAGKSKVDKIPVIVIILHVKGRDNDDDITAIGVDMQVYGGTHHLADIHFSGNAVS